MAPRNQMAVQVARLTQRVAEMERRQENTMRHGVVEEVDAGKQRVRLKIGKGTDGKDQLSPWLPYGQQAGALKIHTPPSKGQNMTLLAPGGDLEQGFVLPMTFNDGNASPSSSAEENVLTYGSVTMMVKADGVTISVGGHSITISAAGTKWAGGALGHDGQDVGKTHKHRDVQPGGGTSGVPLPGGP